MKAKVINLEYILYVTPYFYGMESFWGWERGQVIFSILKRKVGQFFSEGGSISS